MSHTKTRSPPNEKFLTTITNELKFAVRAAPGMISDEELTLRIDGVSRLRGIQFISVVKGDAATP